VNVSDTIVKALLIIFVISFSSIIGFYLYNSNYKIFSNREPVLNNYEILEFIQHIINDTYNNKIIFNKVILNIGNSFLYFTNIYNLSLKFVLRQQSIIIPIKIYQLGLTDKVFKSLYLPNLTSTKIYYLDFQDIIVPIIFYQINSSKIMKNRNEYYIQVIYLEINSSQKLIGEKEIAFQVYKKTAQAMWFALYNETLYYMLNNYTIASIYLNKGDIVQFSFIKFDLNILSNNI